MILAVPPYTCVRTLHQRAPHHNGNMIEGALIAKALTLEPYA